MMIAFIIKAVQINNMNCLFILIRLNSELGHAKVCTLIIFVLQMLFWILLGPFE